MTESAIREALAESVEQTLEKMFFVFGLGERDPSAVRPPGMAVDLAFEGRPSGRLKLRVSTPLAHAIAADFLGIDEPDITEPRVLEVIAEMANMICGSVLSRVENGEKFCLGAPRATPFEEPARPEHAVLHAVDASGGLIEAVLEMDGLDRSPDEECAV